VLRVCVKDCGRVCVYCLCQGVVLSFVAMLCVEFMLIFCVSDMCQCLWEAFVLTFVLRFVSRFVVRLV